MQNDGLTVFDFDGTLIRVNSFFETTKRFVSMLAKRGRLGSLIRIGFLYAMRKCRIISHLVFKKRVTELFEGTLSEREKRYLCQSVFDENLNDLVHKEFVDSENCLVSTAAPFSYISRIAFGRQVPVICSLHPDPHLPDKGNFGDGKVTNLKAYLQVDNLRIHTLFTDSLSDDAALIDISERVFLVDQGQVERAK